MTTAADSVIALNQDADGKPCGRIVFWNMSGDIDRASLVAALNSTGSYHDPPEVPSPVAALRRACDAVAHTHGARIHGTRGSWSIVGSASRDTDELGKKLIYRVSTEAQLVGESAVASGHYGLEVETTYTAVRTRLSPFDMGGWYTDLVVGLGGVALRESGGFYFLPSHAVAAWDAVAKAVAACSGHKLYGLPAMRTTDAVDAVLTAITAETTAECAKLNADFADAGPRALESRKRRVESIMLKVASYEAILATRLDGLRAVAEDTRAAIAAAAFALATGIE